MAQPPESLSAPLAEDEVLRRILEGTAGQTGEGFFRALVANLAPAMRTAGAWVTEYLPDARRLRALAFCFQDAWIDDYEYDIDGTPCEPVVRQKRLIHHPENVVPLYPGDPDLAKFGAVSYMGVPLLDHDEEVIGHLAVLDTRPMPPEPRCYAVFRIFAARAAAELRRVRAEQERRDHEARLERLLAGAMDAILEFDGQRRIVTLNAAAERLFGCPADRMRGADFADFLTRPSIQKLDDLLDELAARRDGPRCLWIAGGLEARTAAGETFGAEATLSRSEAGAEAFHTIVLRNTQDRLEAERRIHRLEAEREYLRDEVRDLARADGLLGRSPPMQRVRGDIAQVGPTDSTVLLSGETGTGKELVARAIHDAGPRRDRPLIRVNCAAIPPALIESEFFGHQKGAFTGATHARAGRFALADGGTIFLDEVGELPLELQPKLLRVLQEGEFEPVGSSTTQRVDVRVIAATNRDLRQAVREGRFREDLYFRLHVFPIHLPPLRERGDDVRLLAEAFRERLARRLGRAVAPLSDDAIRRLRAYGWPGNVRELENVIERAIITSTDGHLNLVRALPEALAGPPAAPEPVEPPPPPSAGRVLTAADLIALEARNIRAALEACGGKVAGDHGAARLLGVPPSTLNSRIKALGVRRPSA